MTRQKSWRANSRSSVSRVAAVATLCLLGACTVSPMPLSNVEIRKIVDRNLARITADQTPISGPIDIHEAMARALKYNLDNKVSIRELALKINEAGLTSYDMLPELVLNASAEKRLNSPGSSSRSLRSGNESLEPSTSVERERIYGDITLGWDILDFGLSYYRAKQAADSILIAREQKRSVVSRLIEDVRTAYWRAASAQRLEGRLKAIEEEIQSAIEQARLQVSQRRASPLSAYTYMREMLTMQREIRGIRRQLLPAKLQLAALMNLEPGTPFEVKLPDQRDYRALEVDEDLQGLIEVALLHRSEIREFGYRQRVQDNQAQVNLLARLPNIKAFLGLNFDTNDFLRNNVWINWGSRVSFDLISLASLGAERRRLLSEQELLESKENALTMAIITQVLVGRSRHQFMLENYAAAREYRDVQEEIMQRVIRRYHAGDIGRRTLLREQLNLLIAEARMDVSQADLENALANVYSAIGMDPLGNVVNENADLPTLIHSIRDSFQHSADPNQLIGGHNS